MPPNVKVWRSAAIQPTVDTDAYTAGDAVGTKQQITGAPASGIIRSIVISDDSDQDINLNCWFFDSEPAGIADDAAFALTDADADRVITMILMDTRYDGVNNRVFVENPNIYYRTLADGDLWFQLEDVGTHNFGTATDLTVRFYIEH